MIFTPSNGKPPFGPSKPLLSKNVIQPVFPIPIPPGSGVVIVPPTSAKFPQHRKLFRSFSPFVVPFRPPTSNFIDLTKNNLRRKQISWRPPMVPFQRKNLPHIGEGSFRKKRKRDEKQKQRKRRKIEINTEPSREPMTRLVERILKNNAPRKMKKSEIIESIDREVKSGKIRVKITLKLEIAVRNCLSNLLNSKRIRRSGGKGDYEYELFDRDIYASDKCIGTNNYSKEIPLDQQIVNLLRLRPNLSWNDITNSLIGIYFGFKKESCPLCQKKMVIFECSSCKSRKDKEKVFGDRVFSAIIELEKKNVIKHEMKYPKGFIYSLKNVLL